METELMEALDAVNQAIDQYMSYRCPCFDPEWAGKCPHEENAANSAALKQQAKEAAQRLLEALS